MNVEQVALAPTYFGWLDLGSVLHLSLVVFLSGLLGLITHPIVKWAKHEIDGSPLDYLLRDDLRASVLSLAALISATVAGVAGHLFEGMNLLQIILLAFPYGYANDSAFNKGSAKAPDATPPA